MANYIPIAGAPDAAGGFLIQPEYADPLVDAIARETAADKVGVRIERTNTRKKIYPRLVGRPTAGFVDEAADAPVSGAEFGKVSIVVKKIATTILYTEEEIEDAYSNPEALVGPEVEQAFALLVDAHVLGMSAGAAITSQFRDEDGNVQDVHSQIPAGGEAELGASNDAFALANSAGAAWVEGNGGQVTGVAVASDARQHIRDARDNDGRPLYQLGGGAVSFLAKNQEIEGVAWTTNLDAFPAGAGKVAAIGGDWTHSRLVIRKDITVKVSGEATVRDGATDHRTWQQDKIAIKYTARMGFGTHQAEKMFYEVTNNA